VATYSHQVDSVKLLRFLTLRRRCHPHAQYEIRVYVEAMCELIRTLMPACVSAWENKDQP